MRHLIQQWFFIKLPWQPEWKAVIEILFSSTVPNTLQIWTFLLLSGSWLVCCFISFVCFVGLFLLYFLLQKMIKGELWEMGRGFFDLGSNCAWRRELQRLWEEAKEGEWSLGSCSSCRESTEQIREQKGRESKGVVGRAFQGPEATVETSLQLMKCWTAWNSDGKKGSRKCSRKRSPVYVQLLVLLFLRVWHEAFSKRKQTPAQNIQHKQPTSSYFKLHLGFGVWFEVRSCWCLWSVHYLWTVFANSLCCVWLKAWAEKWLSVDVVYPHLCLQRYHHKYIFRENSLKVFAMWLLTGLCRYLR